MTLKKPAPKALPELLSAFFEKHQRIPDKLEFLKYAGVEEWEVRKVGGMEALKKEAGLQSVEAKLRLQVSQLRGENTRLNSLVGELEDLAIGADKIKDLIGSADVNRLDPDHSWITGASRSKGTRGIGVIAISDWHLDEVVRSEEIGGCNAFNREIGTKRFKNTVKNAVSLLKSHMARPNYDGLIVNLGGDLVSGNIHEELVETNEFVINQTMLHAEELLIEGIGGLADEFGKVHVPCVTGNHGRMHKKPRAKHRAWHNYEWLIYQHVARYFKNDKRITFDIAEGPDATYSVYAKRYCLTHGDQFRGGEGIGGIMVPIMRGASKKLVRQQAIGNPFDVIIMGHWHQYIHMDRLVINGSIKGYDEFAFSCNFPYEPPQQALWIAHPEHGMTYRMPILCDKS